MSELPQHVPVTLGLQSGWSMTDKVMARHRAAPGVVRDLPRDLVFIPGSRFLMGSNAFYPEEMPAHPVIVEDFWIDRHPVTNAEFASFCGGRISRRPSARKAACRTCATKRLGRSSGWRGLGSCSGGRCPTAGSGMRSEPRAQEGHSPEQKRGMVKSLILMCINAKEPEEAFVAFRDDKKGLRCRESKIRSSDHYRTLS